MKSSFEQDGGTYRQVGNFNIPNLTLPPEEAKVSLGKWGMLHKDYLLNHKKVLFTTLLTQGKLYQHCAEVEKQAQQMFDTVVAFFATTATPQKAIFILFLYFIS